MCWRMVEGILPARFTLRPEFTEGESPIREAVIHGRIHASLQVREHH